MRTRNQSKRSLSVGEQGGKKGVHASADTNDNEILSNISRNAVGNLLKRVNKGFNKEDVSYLRYGESSKMARRTKDIDESHVFTAGVKDTTDTKSYNSYPAEAVHSASNPEKDVDDDDCNDSEWEDGCIPKLTCTKEFQEDLINGVSVEFDVSQGLASRKPIRRATAEEKEVAELVHKTHLLCLLGRGRLVDSACNDPLIQASLLSLVPTHLLKMVESPKLTADHLSPLVNWFHKHFNVRSSLVAEKSCHEAMASALETQEGNPEAVAALSVALFRALNLTTRFVSILDVASLKPDGGKSDSTMEVLGKRDRGIFSSSTLMVSGPSSSSASAEKSSMGVEFENSQTAVRSAGKLKTDKSSKVVSQPKGVLIADKPKDKTSDVMVSETTPTDTSEPCIKSDGLTRKGDLEFQLQLEMALSATAIVNSENNVASNVSESPGTSTLTPPNKKLKIINGEEYLTSSNGISTAIGSKKVGAPLYWAEVFCSGENLTGRWVHVDAVNAIIDGEQKVEAAAAACKKSLRYVVAFAGSGAKDVTRRYCTKWYKVAAQRINSTWWDAVLSPLKELESGATGGADFDKHLCGASEENPGENDVKAPTLNSFASTRSSLEDVELETRALTEPLPTNQQAYRNHHLYAIEKWLKRYQILYPKGPVLGFCSGHPVYPRTCVQTLHTKERWLREGLQLKAGEVPAKTLKRSMKHSKEEAAEDNEDADDDHQGNATTLYGKWQTEPLRLPQAVNGIVPKNERGQVDVWSEKCLPPGTVHLPLPRVALVAKRLGVDFAPAMVGFEYRNGRSVPLFEGIVVCAEFKDAIVEAYFEEEEKRVAEEKRRSEAQALWRWYQLLASMVTRQRLNERYGDGALPQSSIEIPKSDKKCSTPTTHTQKADATPERPEASGIPPSSIPTENHHEHEFVLEEQAVDEEGRTLIKRCRCGFSVQFEEL